MEGSEQIQAILRQPIMVPIGALQGTFRAKREVYLCLSIDCKAYLDDEKNLTIYFLKQLMNTERSYLKQNQVLHVFCPAYEGLSIDDIFKAFGSNPDFIQHMPIPKEAKRLHKSFIVNVAATVVGEPFTIWLKERIQERNQRVTIKRQMMVALDPEIFEAIKMSTQVSLTNGIGCNMLKASAKRRRTKAEVKQDKLRQEQEKEEIAAKLAQFEAMSQKIQNLEERCMNGDNAAQILTNMVNNNQASVDGDGNFLVNDECSSVRQSEN